MTSDQHRERLTMPGHGPTDEDLRRDVDLTRDELAGTIDALAAKADTTTARLRHATRQAATAVAGVALLLTLAALWRKRTRR